MYDSNMRKAMLDILENRVSSIASCIIYLNQQGYVPNKVKFNLLGLVNILYATYIQIDSLNEDEQKQLDILFNNIVTEASGFGKYINTGGDDDDDKDKYPHSGPTTERPELTNANVGFTYFDTTLNMLVIWDGTTWVNTNGDTVI